MDSIWQKHPIITHNDKWQIDYDGHADAAVFVLPNFNHEQWLGYNTPATEPRQTTELPEGWRCTSLRSLPCAVKHIWRCVLAKSRRVQYYVELDWHAQQYNILLWQYLWLRYLFVSSRSSHLLSPLNLCLSAGFGVFAGRSFNKREIIMTSWDTIILPAEFPQHYSVWKYVFARNATHVALSIGYGAIANHHERANMKSVWQDKAKHNIMFEVCQQRANTNVLSQVHI